MANCLPLLSLPCETRKWDLEVKPERKGPGRSKSLPRFELTIALCWLPFRWALLIVSDSMSVQKIESEWLSHARATADRMPSTGITISTSLYSSWCMRRSFLRANSSSFAGVESQFLLKGTMAWELVSFILTDMFFCERPNRLEQAGFEVFTALTMKHAVFWDVAPYRVAPHTRRRRTSR